MNLIEEGTSYFNDPVSLLDDLLSYKIDSTTFMQNEMLVKVLCDSIDTLVKKEKDGYSLMSISVGNNSSIKLISKSGKHFTVNSWSTKEKIEKAISIKIHEEGDTNPIDTVRQITELNKLNYNADYVGLLIAESLTGYCLSKKQLTDHCAFLKQHGKTYTGELGDSKFDESFKLYSFIKKQIKDESKDIRDTILDYAQRLNCDKLAVNISTQGIDVATQWFGVAKIEKVKENGNIRTYQINCDRITGTSVKGTISVAKRSAGVYGDMLSCKAIGNLAIAEVRDHYNDGPKDALERIPYEFIDEGRTILVINRQSYWHIIIGPDPKSATEPPIDNIKHILEQYVDTVLKRNLKVDATIKDGDQTWKLEPFEAAVQKEQQDIKPIQLKLKALKRMLDEYQYIGKKQKAVGQDVTITDKVKYNHTKGEVSYNDFSFSVDDELVKNSFMTAFNQYVVEFYRGTLTEEEILNDILSKVFESISGRINTYSTDETILNIKLNGCVDVKLRITSSKNAARLIYINDQRFNKNEVITVLKEMTCYRNQKEADMFISNIGKLGLSVYIAISTGYEVEFRNKKNREETQKRIFKFRKHKGRSNYSLILDTVEISIVGKTLINTLYSKFIGEGVPDFDGKIPKLVMSSVTGSLEYAKYKFLIDSTYEAFQKNSVDFLTKKVNDVDGKFVKYFNKKNGKTLDAINVVGTTGTVYTIAYDKTNSWVFLNTEPMDGVNQAPNTFKEGKYVCMIDQSNIKSNIGYDTVIAKLMALKNDSIIASKIYNLQEEING